ncbi:hypothetical protein GE061_002116 [Apolygus lucorum]|uniref:Uncharacterized protein n=1 Tax=Apolygus lucorum TaxID=248454 RepID=A0A6A4JHD5_APOLU|nr:hypothetical protein GE061_002116 [Apolygus lucorum]
MLDGPCRLCLCPSHEMPLYHPSALDKLVSRLKGGRECPPARDRSRSLCVEKLAAAVIRPGFDPTCIVSRDLSALSRRRASSVK